MSRIYDLKPWKDRKLYYMAHWLNKRHISADLITFTGLFCGLTAVLCWLNQQFLGGIALVLTSVFADLLDGAVARLSNSGTFAGRFFDAISDRVVETALIGTLIYTGILPWWGWFLPAASVGLLFSRCWAHRLGMETSFIITARFERITAIICVMLIPWRWLTYPLYFLVIIGTVFSSLMIINRIFTRFEGKVVQ